MSTAGWNVAGASVQGTSHMERDVPCQDAHLYRVLPEGHLIIAVADGAGSAARSDEGAWLAVQQAILSLEIVLSDSIPTDELMWRATMAQCFAAAGDAIAQLAAQDGSSLRAFATTLTCA